MPFDAELAKVNLNKDEPAKEKPRRAEKKRKAEAGPWDGDQQEVSPDLQKAVGATLLA